MTKTALSELVLEATEKKFFQSFSLDYWPLRLLSCFFSAIFIFFLLHAPLCFSQQKELAAKREITRQNNQRSTALSEELSAKLTLNSSVSFFDITANKEIFSYNPELELAPASTLKLATSVAALHYLGSSYTFKTEAYLFEKSNQEQILAIKGGGDPEFSTEQAYLFARKLKLSGLKNVSYLVLDDSRLKDPISGDGDRAYQAASSALSFNFNSLGVQVCPNPKGSGFLAEVNPLVWEDSLRISDQVLTVKGRGNAEISLFYSSPKKIEVKGTIGADAGCAERYLNNRNAITSLGLFLKQELERWGVGSNIKLLIGQIPVSSRKILQFESKPLSTLLIGLNHYSTNVTAEQIVAALGEAENSELSSSRGLDKINKFLVSIGASSSLIEDGSGLSRNNRLSSRNLVKILTFAWKKNTIRPFLEASLSMLGTSGTLKKREVPKGDYQVFAKSGTLDGVSALAGYLHKESGQTYAFSIIQNDIARLDSAHKLEEMILQLIADNY